MAHSSNRAYLEDAYRRQFDARVTAQAELGGSPAVILERTWFYPEGGGQPDDRGRIGDAVVIAVRAAGDRILHRLDRSLAPGIYPATIDWERRFDHMQQHSGQHLLSGCFLEVASAETVSFHLGQDECTIDLDCRAIEQEVIDAAEDLANRLVFENRPVVQRLLSRRQAEAAGEAIPDQASDLVRVVEIEDFDRSSCGGTHVRRTGEIGPVKLLKSEIIRGKLRVAFLCGGRALLDYRWRHRALRELAINLTAGEREVPALLTRLIDDKRQADRRLRTLLGELGQHRAEALWQRARAVGARRLVRDVVDDADSLRPIARALVARPGAVVLLGAPAPAHRLVFACHPDPRLDMGRLMEVTVAGCGGRGGGRPDWAEGAMPAAEPSGATEDPAGLPRLLAQVESDLLAMLNAVD